MLPSLNLCIETFAQIDTFKYHHRVLQITCDQTKQGCQLTHLGKYGLPVLNTITFTQDQLQRAPNPACRTGKVNITVCACNDTFY